MKVALRELRGVGGGWCLEFWGDRNEISDARPLLRDLCHRGTSWSEPMDMIMFRDAHPILGDDRADRILIEFMTHNQEIVLNAVLAYESLTGNTVS